MSDVAELHGKILAFLAGEFARKDGRQCVGVELLFSPGNGFKDEPIRKWIRADEPELFDVPGNLAHVEGFITRILEIVEGEADAKPPGKHRFVLRTEQHLGGRATMSFAMAPSFRGGGDETALIPAGGGGKGDQGVISNHASQLMRINAQMFESTIRVLGAQNHDIRAENAELRAENIALRREVEEARSTKMDREFQIAMAAEKNARTNAGFQKLLQLGSVVAAKIGGADEGPAGGGSSPLAILISEFGNSLRSDQIGVLMNTLDMGQKIMFMEIMNTVKGAAGEAKPGAGAGAGANGAAP